MKSIIRFSKYVGGIAVLLSGMAASHAVSNIVVTIQNTNVVITWPSKTNASYLIQFRSAFDTNTLWVNLTNEYPSALSTNQTSFTIYGVVCPPSANGGSSGFNSPPPGLAGLQAALVTQEETAKLLAVHPLEEERIKFLANRRMFPPYVWDIQQRKPHVWELEGRPPMPWETGAFGGTKKQAVAQSIASGESAQVASLMGAGGCSNGMGFYRIFQLPRWPNGISNAVVEGLTFAPIDFDDYFSQIANFTLLVDGQPTELGFLQTRALGGVTNNGVDLWFNEMANGPRQLRMTAELRMDDEIGLSTHTPTVTLTSTLTSVLVSNLILYTNFDSAIVGNSSVFEAFSTEPNIDWTISVYDVVDDFVISQSGYSASGQISWTWNLYDWTGMLRDELGYDPFFYSEITISPHGAAAAAPATKPTPIKALDYPQTGYWLIAFQDMRLDWQ